MPSLALTTKEQLVLGGGSAGKLKLQLLGIIGLPGRRVPGSVPLGVIMRASKRQLVGLTRPLAMKGLAHILGPG